MERISMQREEGFSWAWPHRALGAAGEVSLAAGGCSCFLKARGGSATISFLGSAEV